MLRSTSYSNLSASRVAPDYQHRTTYINVENDRRDNQTIFHSPFKNGKRNPDFTNPTFMSSEIFQHRDHSNSGTPIKRAIIPNRNEIQKNFLRQQRLQKSISHSNLRPISRSASKQQIVQYEDIVAVQMKRQLRTVKEATEKNLSQSKVQQTQKPVYLQKATDMDKIRQETRQLLQAYLKEAMAQKEKRKKKENEQRMHEKKLMEREERRFKEQVMSSKQFEKERASLLKQLLVNQKQAVARK